jgi:hypothetical protein
VDHGAVDDLRRQQRIDVAGILDQVRAALGPVEEAAAPLQPASASGESVRA